MDFNYKNLDTPMMRGDYLVRANDTAPDWHETWSPDEAEEQLSGFKWRGPGWYFTETDSMLVIPTPNWKLTHNYNFLVYNHRNPCEGFNQIVNAPVRVDEREIVNCQH